ncbi:MAG: enoyl-CoA hydratase/isomerase family protein [Polyangiales bacterium]
MKTIVLDFPNKGALGTASMTAILAGLEAAGGAPVMLTGKDAFSAGLDLREVASLDEGAMCGFLELLEKCMTALYLYRGPTVAFVNGHAIAGGSILALCCDRSVVVDDPKLRVGLNEVALGVRFPPRILSIVKQQVPGATIDEVVLGAGLFAPRDAVRVGLIDEVGDEQTARARLEALAQHPAETYAWTKAQLRGSAEELCPSSAHEVAVRSMAPVWASAEIKARLAAVLNRKK